MKTVFEEDILKVYDYLKAHKKFKREDLIKDLKLSSVEAGRLLKIVCFRYGFKMEKVSYYRIFK